MTKKAQKIKEHGPAYPILNSISEATKRDLPPVNVASMKTGETEKLNQNKKLQLKK